MNACVCVCPLVHIEYMLCYYAISFHVFFLFSFSTDWGKRHFHEQTNKIKLISYRKNRFSIFQFKFNINFWRFGTTKVELYPKRKTHTHTHRLRQNKWSQQVELHSNGGVKPTTQKSSTMSCALCNKPCSQHKTYDFLMKKKKRWKMPWSFSIHTNLIEIVAQKYRLLFFFSLFSFLYEDKDASKLLRKKSRKKASCAKTDLKSKLKTCVSSCLCVFKYIGRFQAASKWERKSWKSLRKQFRSNDPAETFQSQRRVIAIATTKIYTTEKWN